MIEATICQPESPVERPLPVTYRWWVSAVEDLLRPLVPMMKPGAADLPLEGPASNHGSQADRLESFARPCLWASHWLAAETTGDEKLSRDEVADWFRQGLVIGTDPKRPSYWGPTTNHHQHTVEMTALVLALEMAGKWLWEPLSRTERQQIADWLSGVRGSGLYRNNHLFFGVIPLSFLLKHGYCHRTDLACVLHWLDILEGMHLGGGWFIDGANESVDYYNAYAFHYYGPWWNLLYGEMDRSRAQRWREWTEAFLRDYVHFFAESGESVPFGRSMTYRFAASAPFALAEKCGISPLSPGLSRRLCTKNFEFFLSRNIQQEQGALSVGWTDEFPAIAEAYSCAGSPYWAAKGLAPLLLPPESAFWTEPEKLAPAESSDFSRPLPQIGLVVRSTSGEIELLNASTSICVGNTAFGPYKWGKLSFRTGVGFEVRPKDGDHPLDASLSAEAEDGTLYARQAVHPGEIESHHLCSLYVLGDRLSQFSVQVESHLWWQGGWQLHVHRFCANQPSRLVLGAYSLAADKPESLQQQGKFPFVNAENGIHHVALQALIGFSEAGHRLTLASERPRTHIHGCNSITLFFQTGWLVGKGCLVSLMGVQPAGEPPCPWKVKHSSAGYLSLATSSDKTWEINHEAIPAL